MNLMTITPAAVERVRSLLSQRGTPAVGIRVGLRARGCSGLTYAIEYADAIGSHDEVIQTEEVIVLLEPKAVMFLIGAEMDFVENELESGFVFRNPHEKGRCGCGESFHV